VAAKEHPSRFSLGRFLQPSISHLFFGVAAATNLQLQHVSIDVFLPFSGWSLLSKRESMAEKSAFF
jgi:hypothetical protein